MKFSMDMRSTKAGQNRARRRPCFCTRVRRVYKSWLSPLLFFSHHEGTKRLSKTKYETVMTFPPFFPKNLRGVSMCCVTPFSSPSTIANSAWLLSMCGPDTSVDLDFRKQSSRPAMCELAASNLAVNGSMDLRTRWPSSKLLTYLARRTRIPIPTFL